MLVFEKVCRSNLCLLTVKLNHLKEQMINESEIVKKIEKDKNIRYFKLPEDNGWNSGRAVLISQVQTEYFVTCDGDFIFNGATRKNIHNFDLWSV